LFTVLGCLPIWAAGGESPPAVESAAPSGCDQFKGDVSRELALMRAKSTNVTASTRAPAEKVLEAGTHYIGRLAAQPQVQFGVKPEKERPADDPHAGLLSFRSTAAGIYRISLSSSHWLDVVDGTRLVASRDFQGRAGCEILHKIVEFDLPANRT